MSFPLMCRCIRESEIYWNQMHDACTVFQKEGVMIEMCNAVMIKAGLVGNDRELSDDVRDYTRFSQSFAVSL